MLTTDKREFITMKLVIFGCNEMNDEQCNSTKSDDVAFSHLLCKLSLCVLIIRNTLL